MKLRNPFRKSKKTEKISRKTPLHVSVSISEVDDSMSQNSQTINDSKPRTNTEDMEIFKYTIKKVYLLASGIGDTTKPFNTYIGHFGRFLWIMNLIIHFSLDFYEATHVFHASWATSIGIYFFAFVLGTIYTIKYSIPCFVLVMKKLVSDGRYKMTFSKLNKIFKIFPYTMPGFAIFGALAQFGCYAFDGALKINFNKGRNSTKLVPTEVEQFLNVLRMTSLLHIFYAFWLFLLLHLIMLYTLQASMQEFNALMTDELKQHPPKIIFSDAVMLFSKRTKLLSKCSEKFTPVLAVILVATSVSFVINAYNFLFLRRFAIYVWFALTPLIWTVTPLIFGAWITMTYRKYKYNVIKAWVEIPEMYDEIWERHFEEEKKIPSRASSTKGSAMANRPTLSSRRESIKVLKQLKRSIENLRRKSVNENLDQKEIVKQNGARSFVMGNQADHLEFTNLTEGRNLPQVENPVINSHEITTADPIKSESMKTDREGNTKKSGWSMLKKRAQSGLKRPTLHKTGSWQKYNRVDSINKGENMAKNIKRNKKFNYEKYLKYLEVILDTIGFSVAGVLVTWDRTSFFCVVLITLVGVFAQAAFLKK